MHYLISDPMVGETRPPNLYRYTDRGGWDADRWDPGRGWISLGGGGPIENVVMAEIDRGSYGMRRPSDAEVREITGADDN